MGQTSRFWDRHAKGYAKRPVPDEVVYQRKLDLTRNYLAPDMDILEFGCGTGTTALKHAPFVEHITAVDISAKMIDIARAKAADGNVENVTFRQSGFDDLTVPDASYDAIMGHSILHLMENWRDVIVDVHRMLKPGGVFVSSTACLAGRVPLMRFVLPVGRVFGLLPQVLFFTADELEAQLVDAGFRIEHRWQPEKSMAVFIVATKPGVAGSVSEAMRASA